MKNFIFIFAIIIVFTSNAFSLIRNVPANYSTIQSAINSSSNGDTILVEPGTYFENINFRGKKIVLTSRFYISNDLSYILNTVINGSTPANQDSASTVIIGNGCDSTAVLQGFKITGGTGTKWFDEHGAGTYREGGGILIYYANPVIRFNIIVNNDASNSSGINGAGGGGIRAGDGKPQFYNNIIMNNTAKYGAGIVLNYTSAILKNNIICANSMSSTFHGGAGIWANNKLGTGSNIIENNTVINNFASVGTGGILAYYSSNLILKNNIVWGNSSPGSLQILTYGGGAVNAAYNNIQGGYSGTGNINLHPAFADSNYILSNSSPCIDAGDTSSVFNDIENTLTPGFAKYPSKGTLRNDIGAYGGKKCGIISQTIIINVKKKNNLIPVNYELGQNYPNPFNPVTVIPFSIPVSGFVSLKIYDLLGREISAPVNEYKHAGNYSFTYHAANLSSGTYFYKLKVNNYTIIKSMVILK